ncbi:hypothetical protein J3459_002439 [Metarhizium acridum]|nr:hypothetical protein J3459_002439 [Metarhizium acridum]
MVVPPVIHSDKAWVTLITNESYLPGLLTLNHSLRTVKSAYPLVALYTPPPSPPHVWLPFSRRGIPSIPVPYHRA